METAALIQTLSDPLGLPFYPQVFAALMVLTFALHIAFVNLAVGTTALALWGFVRGTPEWKTLAGASAKAATASVSGAIVLGVAPLLFVQTLYDPFWYASNLLSAAWVIGFVFVMMAAYGASYLFLGGGRAGAAFGAAALLLYLGAGSLMHAFSMQALAPEKWLGWYAGAGTAATSGTALHAFEPLRFLHFLVPAGTAAGLYLLLRAWYLRARPDMDREALGRSAKLGAGLAFWATAAQALVGFAWLLTVPQALAFYAHPAFLAALAAGLALVAYLGKLALLDADPAGAAVPAAGGTLGVILAMAAAREALRGALLGRFGFSIAAHRVTVDWGSTALFLATFALGGSVLAWVLTLAFQAGRVEGRFTPGPRVAAWGRVSLGLLAGWLLVVAGYGLSVTLRARGL
ncbi:hypothetical protein EPO15_14145 [bacterium]|nr:MAG: hypothetical protein EPO15_14145 [bacterium]